MTKSGGNGWNPWRLEDVAVPFAGAWGADEPTPATTEYTVLGVGNVTNDGALRLEGASKRHLEINEFSAVAKEGDLLVVKSSGSAQNIRSGKTGICPPELCGKIACSNFMIRLAVKREVAEPYLLWLLLNSQWAKEFVRKIAGSSTYPNIKWQQLRDFEFMLPVRERQKFLVARLREQLAEVERARAAVAAQLQAAEALPAAFLREVFSSAAAQKWPRRTLGKHSTKIGSGFTPRGGYKAYRESGIPLIRSQNVHMNQFDRHGLAFISPEQDEEMAGSRVSPDDVLLNITGASIGRVCTAPSEVCPANVNQHVCIIRGDGTFDSEFLAFYIASPDFQKFVWDSQAGATRQALTKGGIENLSVPFVTFEEQKTIAARLNARFREAECLRAQLSHKLVAVEKLPSTLLREAFSGKI